jgi:hypothetical protein
MILMIRRMTGPPQVHVSSLLGAIQVSDGLLHGLRIARIGLDYDDGYPSRAWRITSFSKTRSLRTTHDVIRTGRRWVP